MTLKHRAANHQVKPQKPSVQINCRTRRSCEKEVGQALGKLHYEPSVYEFLTKDIDMPGENQQGDVHDAVGG